MSSKKRSNDWAKVAAPTAKIERMEAFFKGYGFSPHRHDTYALGITLNGVHSFRYRKSMRHSLPGNAVVLHPDELHDGEAGTDEGFHYKILYVPPELIQHILGGKPLPFITDGITTDPRIVTAISSLLCNFEISLDSLQEDDGIYDIAQALSDASGQKRQRKKLNYPAAELARQYMLNTSNQIITMDRLEEISGMDRWTLSRDFRALFGTSPYRYLTLRRLEKAKTAIRAGLSLADTAASCGFTDQSHMTHHFSKAYGISPGRWSDLVLLN